MFYDRFERFEPLSPLSPIHVFSPHRRGCHGCCGTGVRPWRWPRATAAAVDAHRRSVRLTTKPPRPGSMPRGSGRSRAGDQPQRRPVPHRPGSAPWAAHRTGCSSPSARWRARSPPCCGSLRWLAGGARNATRAGQLRASAGRRGGPAGTVTHRQPAVDRARLPAEPGCWCPSNGRSQCPACRSKPTTAARVTPSNCLKTRSAAPVFTLARQAAKRP